MELNSNSKLLRIFVGEIDKLGHQPLYEALLFAARREGMAGCTVVRGVMSFGASTIVHTAKWIDISADLPVVVEIVDYEGKIHAFVKTASEMLEQAGCGGLITMEKAEVLYYKHKRK